ncbi:MAG: DegT/DnrJ/EryC1/StrS family aminotransferase [Thermoplasmata archaeon]
MISIAEPTLGEKELEYVVDCIKSNWISSKGRYVQRFENLFAEYCGRSDGIATSSGTTALHLALESLGIGKGDEVIVPTLTFIATANSVSYTAARPVFVDSHPDYWCMDPRRIEEKLTKNTKAIIPVHLYGHPCDMKPILDLAEDNSLFVVEDAAEAHGAESKGRKVGSFGDVSCFSFYGNKIITTGEGGMCLTDDASLARTMRKLRDHGMDTERKYWHETIGFNYRMTNLQAAIGVAQVEKLDIFLGARRRNARLYASFLGKVEGVVLQPEMPWAKNSFWNYSILLRESYGMGREELSKILEKNQIETRPLFHPVHLMPPYLDGDRFPVAESLSKRGISLPNGPSVEKEDIESICRIVRRRSG